MTLALIKIVITLTKLNGKSFKLNALYIETIESFPDTTITLTNGRKYVVAESEEIITTQIQLFYKSINVLGSMDRGEGKDE